ncbi:hypothetical protein MNBD_GAMMA03-546 [hydrothermal vent metagenome]|uniref:Methyl-accepting chemotaxis protein n=1 Tax=hydrothermal vent metagenome TaxID=652676 RepID=A0A3B0WZE4_9ZZZZ
MSALFDYPKQAEFGHIVAKNKIYERVKPNRKTQEAFVLQVGKIIWKYKLAPKTTNLPETGKVKEIEVFELALKSDKQIESFDQNILRCIDKAIAHPIIFHLTYADKIKAIATYKRPSDADATKWVISDEYFETEWLAADSERQNLPVMLNLSGLYEYLLRELIPLQPREDEGLESHIQRMKQVITKNKEACKLEVRMNKEKQFNRKVEMNAELRKLQDNVKRLKT